MSDRRITGNKNGPPRFPQRVSKGSLEVCKVVLDKRQVDDLLTLYAIGRSRRYIGVGMQCTSRCSGDRLDKRPYKWEPHQSVGEKTRRETAQLLGLDCSMCRFLAVGLLVHSVLACVAVKMINTRQWEIVQSSYPSVCLCQCNECHAQSTVGNVDINNSG